MLANGNVVVDTGEQLREFCCFGDETKLQKLLNDCDSKTVNSQNKGKIYFSIGGLAVPMFPVNIHC